MKLKRFSKQELARYLANRPPGTLVPISEPHIVISKPKKTMTADYVISKLIILFLFILTIHVYFELKESNIRQTELELVIQELLDKSYELPN